MQTDVAWAEARPTALSSGLGTSERSSNTVEVGQVLPGTLRQPGLPRAVRDYPQARVDAPIRSTPIQSPMFYQDPPTGYLVPVPSSVASLSSVNSIPDSRIGGFTAEARGTCQTTEVVDVSQCATGASSQPSTQPVLAEGASGEEKPQNPLIKPQRFDGSQSLKMFLLQFEQLAEYMQWAKRARYYHLCASLEGPAGQVLWELPKTGASMADAKQLLQAKFGTQLQAESFRAKLRARRRKTGESLQDLYRDISRLLQLAYPGEDSNYTKCYGIDSFIVSLNDPALEFEVMKQAPPNLQEAANCAMKLEAYTETLSDRTTVSVERGSGQVPSRSRNVFRTTDEPEGSTTNEATLLERIGQLEKQLEQVAKGNRNARGSSSRKASSKKDGATGRGKPVSENGETVRPNP